MPYIVQDVNTLYRDPKKASADEVEEYLNTVEENGYTLVGILPDHQSWDGDGKPDGKTGTMLVLHKPSEKQRSGRVL